MKTSKARRAFIKAIQETQLPDHEWDNILFFAKVLVNSRRGNIRRPTPEQWNAAPLWWKWKVYLIALLCAKVAELQKAIYEATSPRIS